MPTYYYVSAWSFTDGRDGSVTDTATIEAATDAEAIEQAKAVPPPDLPVALGTCLLTCEGKRVVWTMGGPLRSTDTFHRLT